LGYRLMKSAGKAAEAEAGSLFADCEALVTEKCVVLGNGGDSSGLLSMFGTNSDDADSAGSPVCSGHGRCASSWQTCGMGSANATSTPCCACDFGFAGDGCEQIDARLYVVLASGCVLAMLVLFMLLSSLLRLLRSPKRGHVLGQPLLSSHS